VSLLLDIGSFASGIETRASSQIVVSVWFVPEHAEKQKLHRLNSGY